MPFTLKKQLVTDWENVTQEPRRLVQLPRELTAADVMLRYMHSKAERSTAQQTARAQELMDGVRIYFDKVKLQLRQMASAAAWAPDHNILQRSPPLPVSHAVLS